MEEEYYSAYPMQVCYHRRLLPATLLGARAALASRDSNKSWPKERKKSTSGKISFCVNFYRINITAGAKEERMMMTGLHTVADIYCVCCGSNVGWKYVSLSVK